MVLRKHIANGRIVSTFYRQYPGLYVFLFFDGIKSLNKDDKLYAFHSWPRRLSLVSNYMELTSDIIDEYRNTGGFDIIGSGRTKLEKEDQFEKGLEILKQLDIKALVIIGGDDSNTNACVLAEYYAAN